MSMYGKYIITRPVYNIHEILTITRAIHTCFHMHSRSKLVRVIQSDGRFVVGL